VLALVSRREKKKLGKRGGRALERNEISVDRTIPGPRFRILGSPEVQIALLSERISYMTSHLKSHVKDHASRRGLIMMVNSGGVCWTYLNRRDPVRYLPRDC